MANLKSEVDVPETLMLAFLAGGECLVFFFGGIV